MSKPTYWRVPIESYCIIEANTPDEAKGMIKQQIKSHEFNSLSEQAIGQFLLNASIGPITYEDSPHAEDKQE